jgi:hypothetical protein
VDVSLTDENLFDYPFLYITGHGPLQLTKREQARLRLYLLRGGFVLAEACCGREAFNNDFRDLIADLMPESRLSPLPADHPVFAAPNPVRTIQVSRPAGTGKLVNAAPRLLQLELDGRPAIIYSPDDIGCSWTAGPGITCGIAEGDAYALTVNILMYGLQN